MDSNVIECPVKMSKRKSNSFNDSPDKRVRPVVAEEEEEEMDEEDENMVGPSQRDTLLSHEVLLLVATLQTSSCSLVCIHRGMIPIDSISYVTYLCLDAECW